jgi:hypothetical protein
VKGGKNAHPPTGVLNVPNRFLVYLKIQLYHSSQSQFCNLHQIQVRYLLGVGDGDGEGRFFPFSPRKIAKDEGEGAARNSFLRTVSLDWSDGLVIWTVAGGWSCGLVQWAWSFGLVLWTGSEEGSVD